MQKLPIKTEDEFEFYVWANKKTKEDMVKELDDGMDCMRYAVHTRLRPDKPPYKVRTRRRG